MTEQEFLKILHKRQGNRSVYPSGVYFDRYKERYVRCYRPRFSAYLKREYNRRIRRMELSGKGNIHKKLNEYWWEIY